MSDMGYPNEPTDAERAEQVRRARDRYQVRRVDRGRHRDTEVTIKDDAGVVYETAWGDPTGYWVQAWVWTPIFDPELDD